ncbi:MAG TPA: hypothetical protein VEB86_00960 [Chryseosolibacter sp.]|nr:hypothetical protein [Chryseosolibacter sp.]
MITFGILYDAMNKFFILLTGILLVLALTCFSTSSGWVFAGSYTEGYLSAAGIVALVMMLVNGTFKKTRLFRLCGLAFALFGAGVVFKILHLPAADELLVTPLFVAPVLYSVYFATKRPIGHLDILKFLTVLTFFLPAALNGFELLPEGSQLLVSVLTHLVIWITFADFVVVKYAEGTLFGRS